MSQEDRRMRISLHLSENQNEVQKQIENCADILFRPLMIGEKEKTEAFLIYIEVAVSNLMLEEHKIYGMIGRNGAGKTTLLSILTAQKTFKPTAFDGYKRNLRHAGKQQPRDF